MNTGVIWTNYTNEGIRAIRKAQLRGGRIAVGYLTAWRCPDCRGDWVTQPGAPNPWLLDDSDYTDEGSWER